MCRGWGGEDFLGLGGQLWGGVDSVAVEVDDDLLQAVQLAYDPGDAHPGGVLEVSGYG